MHLVGVGELHGVAGQTDLHAADLPVAHDVVERDGIDDPVVGLERFLERPCVFDAVDHERARGLPQMAVRLDAPFMEVEEQHMRVDVAFHLAVPVVVDDVQPAMGLPCLEHDGENAGILGDAALGKHLQRADERLFQELRAVRFQDLIHGSGNAPAHGIGKHVLRDAPADDEREHGRLRKVRRTVEVPAAVFEVVGVRPPVESDRASELVPERVDVTVDRPQAVMPAHELAVADAQAFVFPEDAFRRRAAVFLQERGEARDPEDLHVPGHGILAAFFRFPAVFRGPGSFLRGSFFHLFLCLPKLTDVRWQSGMIYYTRKHGKVKSQPNSFERRLAMKRKVNQAVQLMIAVTMEDIAFFLISGLALAVILKLACA